MALFSTKKTKKAAAPKEVVATTSTPTTSADLAHVLRHARITEKATMHSQQGVYVFDVAETATKRQIMSSVHKLYGVMPRKVRVAPVPSKTKRSARTGKTGVKKGGKKAYVYLKEGEAINI